MRLERVVQPLDPEADLPMLIEISPGLDHLRLGLDRVRGDEAMILQPLHTGGAIDAGLALDQLQEAAPLLAFMVIPNALVEIDRARSIAAPAQFRLGHR